MRLRAGLTLLLSLAVLWGCSRHVVVPVPPRMELGGYGTLGIIEFASNAPPTIEALATRQFQEQIHAAQPGTRLIELGTRQTLLAAVGSRRLDAEAFRKIGQKYGVAAVFLGDLAYSQPKVDVRVMDIAKLEGQVRTEVRADIASRLVETRTGASVWSSSAWVKRQIGRVDVSSTYGVSGGVRTENFQEEMVSDLVYHLTDDFRPTSVRQRVD